MLSVETMRYLQHLVMEETFFAADPDFRSRVQLAVTALDELDAALVARDDTTADDSQLSVFDQTRSSVYGGSPE